MSSNFDEPECPLRSCLSRSIHPPIRRRLPLVNQQTFPFRHALLSSHACESPSLPSSPSFPFSVLDHPARLLRGQTDACVFGDDLHRGLEVIASDSFAIYDREKKVTSIFGETDYP